MFGKNIEKINSLDYILKIVILIFSTNSNWTTNNKEYLIFKTYNTPFTKKQTNVYKKLLTRTKV